MNSLGDSIKLSHIQDELILVDFWFLACPPCRESFPYLQLLSQKYKNKGLKVIGVNFIDTPTKGYTASKLKDSGIAYPLLFSNKIIQNQLGITKFPSFLMFDKNQNLVYYSSGYSKEKEAEIELIIERILNKAKIDK